MSVSVARVEPSVAEVGDYIALMKPRVMSLVVFTALVGLAVAPGHLHPVTGFTALLCIAVGAGAAGALNMWYDADIDAVMTRTARRPVPMGRVLPGEALAFGLTLAGFSIVTLGLLVNWLAAGLLAFTLFFYVVIYTIWLKRSTPQNIVIGGAAGAFPPMIGWAAVTGSLSWRPRDHRLDFPHRLFVPSDGRPLYSDAASRLRIRRLVLAFRRRRMAVSVRLHICLGIGRAARWLIVMEASGKGGVITPPFCFCPF